MSIKSSALYRWTNGSPDILIFSTTSSKFFEYNDQMYHIDWKKHHYWQLFCFNCEDHGFEMTINNHEQWHEFEVSKCRLQWKNFQINNHCFPRLTSAAFAA